MKVTAFVTQLSSTVLPDILCPLFFLCFFPFFLFLFFLLFFLCFFPFFLFLFFLLFFLCFFPFFLFFLFGSASASLTILSRVETASTESSDSSSVSIAAERATKTMTPKSIRVSFEAILKD